eukprot:UN26590
MQKVQSVQEKVRKQALSRPTLFQTFHTIGDVEFSVEVYHYDNLSSLDKDRLISYIEHYEDENNAEKRLITVGRKRILDKWSFDKL